MAYSLSLLQSRTAAAGIIHVLLFSSWPLAVSSINTATVTAATTDGGDVYTDTYTCPAIAHNDELLQLPQWAWLCLVCLQSIGYFLDHVLVPIYSFLVVIYLCLVYFQYDGGDWGSRLLRLKRQRQQQLQRKKRKRRRSVAAAVQPLVAPSPTTTLDEQQPIDLSGSWQLTEITNLDNFLGAQGVPWALRRAASKVKPKHHIRHVGQSLTINIDAGVINTTTCYTINGGQVETLVRGRLFRDEMRYYYSHEQQQQRHVPEVDDDDDCSDNNNDDPPSSGVVIGVLTSKIAVTEGYNVSVLRVLSEDGQRIDVTSTAWFPNDPEKDTVVSHQIFQRIIVSQ